MAVHFDEDKQDKKIADLRSREEEELAKLLSERYGLPYLDLTRLPINSDAVRLLPEATAEEGNLALFDVVGKKLKAAVLSPKNPRTAEILQEFTDKGYLVSSFMVSKASLAHVWARYKDFSFAKESAAGVVDISNEAIEKTLHEVKTVEDIRARVETVLAEKKTYHISRLLEIMLAGALAVGASDLHLEPEEAYVRLRYRLDGVLMDISTFDLKTFLLLLSRLKLISGLKLNLKDTSQDGRFSIKAGSDIEIRTSILPGAYGESLVLRILNPQTINVPMDQLGIEPALYAVIEREIMKPNGMLLTTGPTGSGKTTTLYSFLRKIHTSEVKIITIEDPIEYHLPGIVQTQADHKNYTFAAGLRAALRQDPDVIMVGEIRDGETADIAINAGLTGHLVLSTLHTNNAAGAIPRLIDLGVNSRVISSAINVVLAQRLVRKLCGTCAKERAATPEEAARMNAVLTSVKRRELIPTELKLKDPVGCPACNGTGYRGRIGIFEAVLMTEKVEEVLNSSPSEREIAKASEDQDILTMPQDGVLKALRGVTSLAELERVVELQ
ncbi:GspE/PulE family protein [Candidatus Parcubacteria bacterium]|nr:GspE/PulE family protein [Candidatus Parcubacteria bacterium]